MGYFFIPLWFSLTLLICFSPTGVAFADPYPLRIYAAASLTGVMKKNIAGWSQTKSSNSYICSRGIIHLSPSN